MGKELDKAAHLIQTAIQTNTPVFVFDVETEWLDPVKHHIIQLSALKIDPETFEVLDKINVFININLWVIIVVALPGWRI